VDLRQLRYFAQIVESGSLSKASRQLFIAQPALSQQVSKLEGEVGKPLLNRSSRGVAPTENGLALYHHARFMLRQLDQALSIARQESGAVQGMVSVGLPATTVAALGLPLVRRVRERYPSIMLNVVEGMSGHLGQMMRLGQLDLAVLFASDVAFDLSVEPLLEEELFVILPKKSPLVAPRRTSIAIEEAAALPLILPTSTHGLRRRIAAEFEQRSLSARIVAEIDSLSLLMNCVHDGMGATIKPMAAVYLEGARGRHGALSITGAHEPPQLHLLACTRAPLDRRRCGGRRAARHGARPDRIGRLDRRADDRADPRTSSRRHHGTEGPRPGNRMMPRLVAFAALLVAAATALAQPYPSRPVRLIVGFTPGGGVDINARMLAPRLSEYLGQPVIVENRPGAGTNIANELVAKSAPDGYTLLINTPAVAINMALYRNLPYDTLRDFAPVSVFSESPNVLVVNAKLAAQNVKELIAMARSAPGKLNYSSAGVGTTQHLAAELFKLRTGTYIVHIPYKGTAPSLTGLIAGEVDLSFANIPSIQAHVKSGRLRALAVTAPRRDPQLPEVPTMKEVGLDGVEVVVWYGVLAPAATPREIIQRRRRHPRAAHEPEVGRMLEQGAVTVGNTPEEFGKLLREEVTRWAEVVKVSGARAD
jgi:LysR family tcuABC transcriptional regulator